MARSVLSGLILNPSASAGAMASLDIHFEPAMIISARKVDKLGLSIRSFREPLTQSIREVMIPSIKRNFAAEGRPGWAQLSQSTVRRRGGSAHPILVRSGALRRGATSFSIWTVDSEKAFVADLPQSIWYGKTHQKGHGSFEGFYDPVIKKHVNLGDDGALPARPFIVLQPQDQIRIKAVFNRWLRAKIAAAGLSGR